MLLPSCGLAVGRDARPRWLTASRRRTSLPVAARHRGAWLGIPHPPPVPRCRAYRPCGLAVGRDVWPPGLPARAAAPSARCAAWQIAHAESFACRGSVRGTVRGRAVHPARYPYRAAIYTRNIRTATGRYALPARPRPWRLGIPRPRPRALARGGSPPRTLPRSRLRHQRQPPPARTIGRIALRPAPHQLADA